MKTRVITGVVSFLLLVPFLIWSGTPAFLFVIMTFILSMVAAYEVLHCTGFSKNIAVSLLTYLAVGTVNVLPRIIDTTEKFLSLSMLVYFTYLFFMFVHAVFSRGKLNVSDIAVTASMVIYTSFAFSLIVRFRDLELVYENSESAPIALGKYFYLLIFIFSWFPDIGGYFIGRAFGKKKLIPEVSPKKTVAGLIGGIMFAVVAALVYAFVLGAKSHDIKLYFILAAAAVVSALVSVCGDLIASLVKRRYEIKDYGFVFPGHGGVLDRFDSVVAVAPFLFIIFYVANELGLFADIADVLQTFSETVI